MSIWEHPAAVLLLPGDIRMRSGGNRCQPGPRGGREGGDMGKHRGEKAPARLNMDPTPPRLKLDKESTKKRRKLLWFTAF